MIVSLGDAQIAAGGEPDLGDRCGARVTVIIGLAAFFADFFVLW